MSIISRVTTWADGQTLFSSDLNAEFNNIVNLFNNLDAASSTWSNVKISSTASNPLPIASSATVCELSTDCSGTNGTPIHTFKRSATTYFTAGVDGAASNLFKFGTTSLTSNVAWQVPSGGKQVQFAHGGSSAPAISVIGDATTGFDGSGSGGVFTFYGSGTASVQFAAQGLAFTDGTVAAPGIFNITDNNMGITRLGTHDMAIVSNGASGGYIELKANGDLLTSQLAPLATNATAGFFFLPTVGGTPTGTPTSYTGQAAILIDTSGSKIWARIGGAWKSVAVA